MREEIEFKLETEIQKSWNEKLQKVKHPLHYFNWKGNGET